MTGHGKFFKKLNLCGHLEKSCLVGNIAVELCSLINMARSLLLLWGC